MSSSRSSPLGDDARFIAGVKLIERMGSKEFQIRYCDEEQPVAWIAAARFLVKGDNEHHDVWQLAGALTPAVALSRLLELTMDGGRCTHCQRMTSVDDRPPDDALDALAELVCFYRYDPDVETYRRGCEDVAP